MKTAAFLLLALATATLLAATDDTGAQCASDTECAMLCPETDTDCDGGPESAK